MSLLPMLLALSLLPVSPGDTAAVRRAPAPERIVPPREEPPRGGPEVTPPNRKQHIFGIGVGFQRTGTFSGVPLDIVLAGSPAFRSGLTTGCVVAEINGESTIGRSGDDCARMIRDALSTVRIKFFDPALREHTVTLQKEWIVVPE